MSANPLGPSQRAWWQRFLLYALLISSTFTIAGDEACMILLMALALAERWREGPGAWQGLPAWLVAPFLLLPAVAVVSALVNPDPLTTFDHMRVHYRIFLPFALLPVWPRADLRRLFLVYAVCLGLMALYGAVQYRFGVDWFRPAGEKLITHYGQTDRFHAKGNFTHHLTYAGFMLLNVPFFASLALSDRGRWRWAWWAGAGLAALATVLSLGRSGWLGMGVGLLVLAAIRLPRRWGLAVVAAGIAATVLMGVLLSDNWLMSHFYHRGMPAIAERLIRTGLTTDIDRVRLWESGLLAIRDKPVLGHGWGNQDPALEPFRQQISAANHGYQFKVKASAGLHNIYLQMAFAVGIVGLLAYLSLWAALFAWCARGIARAGPGQGFERALLQGIAGALAGSMAAGWFENNFLDGEVQTLIAIWFALAFYAGLRILRTAAPRPGEFTP